MRILIVLTYYQPHISGLTIYVARLARALVERGHEVTVLTSQYDRALPRDEVIDGVNIMRAPVLMRVSKGVIMPTFGFMATRLTRQHDVVHLHLPQFDAPGLALRGRLMKKPVVLTYHCDLLLPPGLFNRIANSVVLFNNWLAGRLADAVVAYTEDYAIHSRFLSRLLDKVKVIPPPVVLPPSEPGAVERFAAKWDINDEKVIGMSARMATEKGVEVLLRALPVILAEFPDTRILFANPPALGEEEYVRRLQPLLEKYTDHWTFLGTLEQSEMRAFYANCDLTVLPSLNSTESFGLVQIEGMLCGAPSVASNLPGVRQPVLMTGMGEIAPIGDPEGLGQTILKVLRDRTSYIRPAEVIERPFLPATTAQHYEALFDCLLTGAPRLAEIMQGLAAYAELRMLADINPHDRARGMDEQRD
jgi:glycosyltransferase involved in cell wall biosynthesis